MSQNKYKVVLVEIFEILVGMTLKKIMDPKDIYIRCS